MLTKFQARQKLKALQAEYRQMCEDENVPDDVAEHALDVVIAIEGAINDLREENEC